jgi:hypothetical protein
MPSRPTRLITAAVMVLACLGGMSRLTGAAEAGDAANARGETLFGMNVPSLRALDDAESALGARAAIVGTFADWAHDRDFPRDLAHAINERGAVPMISWEPWDSRRGTADQPAYALARIVAGDHDALIDRWAREIRAYRRPVMLRFAPEMNGDWLPWSTGVNGNRPGAYVAAWRHVRARFRSAGAKNAVWVWNPIATYDGATPLRELFPGRSQVDWLAVDGYNWGSARAWGWQGYADVFAATLHQFAELAPEHPAMIAEAGSAPDPRKAAWIADVFRRAHADGVDALVWFEFAKETDWRLAETPATAHAASRALHAAGWRPGGRLTALQRSIAGAP